ncbi:MAG: hypothetical protein BWY45_01240 [Euryarchaeota archaeon ADurb.Bin294]|nr:MAG: hypothetical protein BWY45_01240 [Euryarchaeota archaeon ADurb.Bin294]
MIQRNHPDVHHHDLQIRYRSADHVEGFIQFFNLILLSDLLKAATIDDQILNQVHHMIKPVNINPDIFDFPFFLCLIC